MQPDLRAECLAMAERGDAGALHPQEAAALLRRVAGALPQEPQGDVVEAAAEAAYLADDHRLSWPWGDVANAPAGKRLTRMICAVLSAAEPFIQTRIAAEIERCARKAECSGSVDGYQIAAVIRRPDPTGQQEEMR